MSSCNSDPARTAALMRRQRIHQEQAIPMDPHAHAAQGITGSTLGRAATALNEGGEMTGAAKGWLT
jgi:hypothetical protein